MNFRISREDYKGSFILGKERGFTNAIQLQIVHPVIGCLHAAGEIKCLWFISIKMSNSHCFMVYICRMSLHSTQFITAKISQTFSFHFRKLVTCKTPASAIIAYYFFDMLSVNLHPNTLHTFHLPWTQTDLYITWRYCYDNATFSHTLAGNLELLSIKRTGLNEVIDPFCLLLHQKIYNVLIWLSVWISNVFWSTSILDTSHRRTKPSCQNIRF